MKYRGRFRRLIFILLWSLCACQWSLLGGAAPFRTDADGGDEKLPWFQLKPGEFPPEGSAHYLAGELIALDHINRTGVLRPDRTNAQRRGDWDLPLPFTLLPYGSLSYHGAPAELRDIPIGTHLHGQFYLGEQEAKDDKAAKGKKLSTVGAFNKALRLEDDFSFLKRQQRTWRVDAVQLDTGTLTVTGVGPAANQVDAKPMAFKIGPSTRVWKAGCMGSLGDIATGESLLINLTVCTLKGPGRCLTLWLDEVSRDVATTHQLEVHRQFQREHGLAAWVDEVDNQRGIVAVTLFAGFNPKLKDDFVLNEVVTACVAEDSLRTWDQINDRKSGPVLEVQTVPTGPGNSGVRLKFKPDVLLEGFRPKRIVRLFSSKWKVDDLPREERLYQ